MSAKRSAASESKVKGTKIQKIKGNKESTFKLNRQYFPKDVTNKLSKSWTDKQDYADDGCGIQLRQAPFTHCVLSDFIEDPDVLDKLQEELDDLQFVEKNNDLYKFHQTKEDLKSANCEYIKALRELICNKLRDWLIQVTGIPLNDTVDMFCAQYRHTDTLLCHDDELEGRRIAYIYYLVNNWTHDDGGALDLYTVDDNIQPVNIVKSILPARNSFVFFEVSPGSYHQVAEILSEDKTRLSVGGWFHGPPITRPTPYIERPPTLHTYGSIDDEVFYDWINPVYLNPGALGDIQDKFETESEIELQDFIQRDKYEALMLAMMSDDITWKQRGPPTKRCYCCVADNKTPIPSVIQTCVDLFQSDAMFLLLSNLTGLKLHELAGSSSESEAESDREPGGMESESTAGSSNGPSKNGSEKEKEDAKNEKKVVKNKAYQDVANGEANSEENKEKTCTARCNCEVQRWKAGCYTLAHDTDTRDAEYALDLAFYIGCQDWSVDYGGFTSYIARGEDEELLTVTPQENSLALVYRDRDTLRFVKHLNTQTNNMLHKGFYNISTVYYE